jgi:catechol 2,3-dioxygenase-like lactoylglutathione lyase family enzyme
VPTCWYITGLTRSVPVLRPMWCSSSNGAPSKGPPTRPPWSRKFLDDAFVPVVRISHLSSLGTWSWPLVGSYRAASQGRLTEIGGAWSSHFSKPAGPPSCHPVPVIKRIVAYADGDDLAASRDFYVGLLGFEVAMEDPVLGLTSPTNPTAQVLIPPRGMENPPPRFGIDVGDPRAVDAAHAEALRRGLRVVYPLTDEPWGVRRFFVEDPSGTVVNVLAHLA